MDITPVKAAVFIVTYDNSFAVVGVDDDGAGCEGCGVRHGCRLSGASCGVKWKVECHFIDEGLARCQMFDTFQAGQPVRYSANRLTRGLLAPAPYPIVGC